jgi:hypothetical protein
MEYLAQIASPATIESRKSKPVGWPHIPWTPALMLQAILARIGLVDNSDVDGWIVPTFQLKFRASWIRLHEIAAG